MTRTLLLQLNLAVTVGHHPVQKLARIYPTRGVVPQRSASVCPPCILKEVTIAAVDPTLHSIRNLKDARLLEDINIRNPANII